MNGVGDLCDCNFLATTATIDTSVCDSLISPSGLHVWKTNGAYMDTVPNRAGCDSVITVNLTIEDDPIKCGFDPCTDQISITPAILATDPHQSVFHAAVSLTAQGVITSLNLEDLAFIAAQEVILLEEFVVELGAQLSISIAPCDP